MISVALSHLISEQAPMFKATNIKLIRTDGLNRYKNATQPSPTIHQNLFCVEYFSNHTPNPNPFWVFLWNNPKYGAKTKKFVSQILKNSLKFEFGVNDQSKTTFWPDVKNRFEFGLNGWK